MYAQKRIQSSDKQGAIDILESCKASHWPEVYRILSRLLADTDPQKSLEYADIAISLGDLVSCRLKSDLLDRVTPSSPVQISSTRLLLISQLICKLDASFAYNAGSCDTSQRQRFISFITGTPSPYVIHLQHYNF